MKPKKRVLILGIDGYIGWPLALHLLNKGHVVAGVDNFSRRDRVEDAHSNSLTPIASIPDRRNMLEAYPIFDSLTTYDMFLDSFYIKRMFKEIKPDVIVHLAEQPSASWSMQSTHFCNVTQTQNLLSTLNILWAMKESVPDAHLIKLGTMGEYGKPNCEIPEGMIPKSCKHIAVLKDQVNEFTPKCPLAGLPFPKSPNSFYHLSKVHDTNNIIFACKTWGLTSTDIMQGVVFGLNDPMHENHLTRFDYDEHFGTVINRFCAQAITDHPLVVYGSGKQTYSFLPLKDSIQCIDLILNSPPKKGEYRTINQFNSIYSVNQLAEMVCNSAARLDLKPSIMHISNPRTEVENEFYAPVKTTLHKIGYQPTINIQREIDDLVKLLLPFKDMVNEKVFMPKTNWK